jgi:hypothetical protein
LLFKGLDLVRYKEGKLLFVRTYWQPLAPLPEGLEIKLSLLNEDGEPFAGTPLHPLPMLIWYPPHRWKAGETVKVDTIPWDLGQYFVVALKVSAGGDWRVKDFKANGPIVLLYGDTIWVLGRIYRDERVLDIPSAWDKMEVGLYRWQDLTRLPVGGQDAFTIKGVQEGKAP